MKIDEAVRIIAKANNDLKGVPLIEYVRALNTAADAGYKTIEEVIAANEEQNH